MDFLEIEKEGRRRLEELNPKTLTPEQKMLVTSIAFYSGQKDKWIPNVGDYYTTPRADLELYKIVEEDEDNFYTVYCHNLESGKAKWLKKDFLKYFGVNRIHVPWNVFNL